MDSKHAAIVLIAAASALAAGHPLSARADTIVIDNQLTVRKSDIARPARGLTMTGVEAKFGAPRSKHDAVGAPPITRWDYPQFAVFFEKDRVIDAVIPPGSTPAESSTAASQAAAAALQPSTNAPQAPTAPSTPATADAVAGSAAPAAANEPSSAPPQAGAEAAAGAQPDTATAPAVPNAAAATPAAPTPSPAAAPIARADALP